VVTGKYGKISFGFWKLNPDQLLELANDHFSRKKTGGQDDYPTLN
jgi:hypothetical protein